jgi:hypothetical protein
MPNLMNFTNYRGHDIMTRCTALASMSQHRAQRFDAFFRIDPPLPDDESWQRFLADDFGSRMIAEAHALTAAKRSIDLDLAVYD